MSAVQNIIKIKILEVIGASIILANRAAGIINCVRTMDMHIVDKSFGKCQFDPTTVADYQSQKLIIGHLRSMFPGIVVKGEEEELMDSNCAEYQQQHQSEQALLSVLPRLNDDVDRFCLIKEFGSIVPVEYESVALDKVVVWVDPLDGTKEYTEGKMEAVTVLIGISVDGVAVAGIMQHPQTGHTYWGLKKMGAFCATGTPSFDPTNICHKPIKLPLPLLAGDVTPNTRRCIVTTRSHMSAALQQHIDSLNPTEVRRFGGCGGKSITIIEGTADAYVYTSIGTKRWDTCAPDAIISAAGGRFTDGCGESIDYRLTDNFNNLNGLVCSHRADQHTSYIPKIRSNIVATL